MTSQKAINGIFMLALIMFTFACATQPKQIVVNASVKDVSDDAPASSPSVVIENVKDTRFFFRTIFTGDQSPPTLVQGVPDDVENKARTLGLLWSSKNKPLFNVTLPEGKTVEDLVGEALRRAFTLAEFNVVEPGEQVEDAIPVSAEIVQFWYWNTGTWAFNFHFLCEVAIHANIPPFEAGETISGTLKRKSVMGGRPTTYLGNINEGLEIFVQNLKARIESAK